MDWGSIAEQERNDWVDAAVMIPVYRRRDEDHLILTKRTEEVVHHKGQICFPGGARDPGDLTLWETALRECQEEIGLDPRRVALVRELGRQYTPTGFRVTPFIGQVEEPLVFTPNPNEIAAVFSVPFSYLSNPKNVRFLRKEWQGRVFLDPHILFEGHEIWGMTGRILCELFEIKP
ncbi:MAG TPA: CoA pyrophosphatase [bacterium]|nr:CoA pyrophosphatase [bacterium]